MTVMQRLDHAVTTYEHRLAVRAAHALGKHPSQEQLTEWLDAETGRDITLAEVLTILGLIETLPPMINALKPVAADGDRPPTVMIEPGVCVGQPVEPHVGRDRRSRERKHSGFAFVQHRCRKR